MAEVIDAANRRAGTPRFKVGDIGKVTRVVPGIGLDIEIGNKKHPGWNVSRFKFLARPSDLQDIEIDLSAYQGDERLRVFDLISEFAKKCGFVWVAESERYDIKKYPLVWLQRTRRLQVVVRSDPKCKSFTADEFISEHNLEHPVQSFDFEGVEYDWVWLIGNFEFDSAIANSALLVSCFRWGRTPQGHDFWSNVHTTGHTPESLAILRDMKAKYEKYVADKTNGQEPAETEGSIKSAKVEPESEKRPFKVGDIVKHGDDFSAIAHRSNDWVQFFKDGKRFTLPNSMVTLVVPVEETCGGEGFKFKLGDEVAYKLNPKQTATVIGFRLSQVVGLCPLLSKALYGVTCQHYGIDLIPANEPQRPNTQPISIPMEKTMSTEKKRKALSKIMDYEGPIKSRDQFKVFFDDGSVELVNRSELPREVKHGRIRKSVNFAAYWGLWRSLRLVTWDSTKWLAKNGGMAIASIPLVGLGYYGLEKVGAFEFVRSLIG